ncbi:MAG: hypothetical protein K2N89_11590 [Lachnospiraceae bacterium]|nr:hypothetical protein [Lachnospiraceae bacterium]
MKKVYLFLVFITICTLTGCGFRVEANEDKFEKLYRIEIQDVDGTNIVTLEELSNKEMVRFFDDEDGKWNTALFYSEEGLTPQYIINVYQEKTQTVIQTEDGDAYEKVLTYMTYEDSDIVKVVVDENTVHGMVSEDDLTFYYRGTEKFFSALNDAISDASDS